MTQTFTHGYGLIVGVGADLPETVTDATAVADLLREPSRCAYPREQVQLLTSEQASRKTILAALDTLASQVSQDPEATVIVYFSGHGIEMPGFHLMPFGYDLSDLDNTAIAGTLFTEKLRAINARKLVVLLDCCHAGGQADAKEPPWPKSPLPPSILEEFGRSSGRVVIASSRKDEKSFTGKPYSVFTAALLKGLAGYGAFERDSFARVLDVTMYVGRDVANRTKDKQHPIIKVSNLESNFALAYYAGGSPQPKTLDWAEQVQSIAEGLDDAQVATWQRMLANKRKALLLIEERMSEYIQQQDIPLQLVQNHRKTKADIADLEKKLGLRFDEESHPMGSIPMQAVDDFWKQAQSGQAPDERQQGAGRPVEREDTPQPTRPLSPADLNRLVELLLACPSMQDKNLRDDVVSLLPDRIRNAISRRDHPKADVLNIVKTCQNYDGGLEALIAEVRSFDRGSNPMQAVDDFWKK